MKVGMAVNTLLSDPGEFEGGVALAATHGLVLANQREPGFAMVEGQGLQIDLPGCRAVATHAIDLEPCTMGRGLGPCCSCQHHGGYQR